VKNVKLTFKKKIKIMPRLPHESIPMKIMNIIKNIHNKVNTNIFTYSIFAILITEVISIFLADRKDYLFYWMPLLSNIIIAILVLQNLPKAKLLRFCFRKKLAYYALSLYYIFNIICLLFQCSDSFYSCMINYGLLSIVWLLVFLTLINKKDV
jgi:hypothetical protein